jgi:hypothetical protein
LIHFESSELSCSSLHFIEITCFIQFIDNSGSSGSNTISILIEKGNYILVYEQQFLSIFFITSLLEISPVRQM